MRIHVIGCSGSFAAPHSAASSYLIEQDDADGRTWRVLLDLGSGAFGPLQRIIDPTQLDAVVISHLHPDHYLDLTGLEVFWAYHERQDLPQLPLHGPADLAERLSAVLSREGTVPDGVDCEPFDYCTVTEGSRFEIGPLAFVARTVRHPVEAYAFRVTSGQEVFAYSGDSDECPALDEIAAGADLFLCEAGYIEGRDDRFDGIHLTGRRAGRTAARAGVGQLALTHIPAWTDPAVPEAEAKEVFDGPVRLVHPMDILDVAR